MADGSLVYYVEDDEHVRDLTAYALRQTGFQVRTFAEGNSGRFVAVCAEAQPAVVLLDIMLPGDDGLDLLRALRSNHATEDIPVMMLTAKGTEFDKVIGLDAGADDYLAKPYGMMELISRVNALVRRAARPSHATGHEAAAVPDDETLRAGVIELSPSERTAFAGGSELSLTRKEFDLLCCLIQNKGRVLSREQLLEAVWGVSFVGETRTVDMHVKTLRKKLAEASPGAEESIITVRGSGYRLRKGDR